MRREIIYIILFFSLLQYACERSKQQVGSFDIPLPEVVEAKGYVVPEDKMAPPEISPAKEIKSKAINKPTVVILNSNVHPVGKPIIVLAGAPICTNPNISFAIFYYTPNKIID